MAKRQKPGAPDVAIAVLRASTSRQELSPRKQMAAIERWAEHKRVRLVAVFIDQGVSGAAELSEREGLLGALAAAPDLGAGVLVFDDRTRLARDIVKARLIEHEAIKAGAVVRTADGRSDGDDVLGRGLADLVSEHERAQIRERTRAALRIKKARGERVGQVPFGWRALPDGRLERNEDEQRVIRLVAELRAQGLTTRAIAAELSKRGYAPRSGRAWHKTQVVRMLNVLAVSVAADVALIA